MPKPIPTESKTAAIALRVSPELAEALTARAELDGVSRNELINDALGAYLAGAHTARGRKAIANAARDAVLAAMGVAS